MPSTAHHLHLPALQTITWYTHIDRVSYHSLFQDLVQAEANKGARKGKHEKPYTGSITYLCVLRGSLMGGPREVNSPEISLVPLMT